MSYDSPQVLLIEEDPLLAEVTGFRLELLGYRIETAASGEEATEAIERQMPDAIILDTTLPDVDGFELTNRISNEPRTAEIPILVISSNADLHEVERAHAAGAKDYLVIPYNPTMLEQKLEAMLQAVGKSL